MNAFATTLYAALADNDENLFFSPYSIATALAMTAEGARGETAQQMAQVLGNDDPALDAQQRIDLAPLHAQLAGLGTRLAPKPTPPALLKQIETLKRELARANAELEHPKDYDAAYFALGRKAEEIARQINDLQRTIDPTEFRSANALWLEQRFPVEPSYLASLATHYRTAGAKPVDFRSEAEASRKTINDWVAAQTEQRIQDLIAPGMVDETTRLVLTNAVYFLGEWLEPFDSARTRNEPFTLRDGSRVDAALMHARKSDAVRYAAFRADGNLFDTPRQIAVDDRDETKRYPQDGFQVVELPYRGDALTMQLILPMRADGLAAVEKLLDAEHLTEWNAALAARDVEVTLPKFRMEAGFELSKALQQLGLRRAFVNPADLAAGAEFDGISAGSNPAERLFIGAVVHKAFVAVDEKGTEAAAATAVMMAAGAAMPVMVDFTPVFRADRPFLFLIRERDSGAVLFLGRLLKP